MKNLKFPEISKKIQQSVFGAYGGAYSDDFWCDNGSGGQLDEVIIYSTYDWGDTFGGEQNDYGDADSSGSGSNASGGETEQVEGWGNQEFEAYYLGGNGQPVSLHQMGHFENIRNSTVFTELMERVNGQIEDEIQKYIDRMQDDGCSIEDNTAIEYDFLNSYDFTDDVWAIGGAYVSGVLSNLTFSTANNGHVGWEGSIYLTFHDVFEDPLSLYEWGLADEPVDYGDPFIINESWSETINGGINGAVSNGCEYEYGYGY